MRTPVGAAWAGKLRRCRLAHTDFLLGLAIWEDSISAVLGRNQLHPRVQLSSLPRTSLPWAAAGPGPASGPAEPAAQTSSRLGLLDACATPDHLRWQFLTFPKAAPLPLRQVRPGCHSLGPLMLPRSRESTSRPSLCRRRGWQGLCVEAGQWGTGKSCENRPGARPLVSLRHNSRWGLLRVGLPGSSCPRNQASLPREHPRPRGKGGGHWPEKGREASQENPVHGEREPSVAGRFISDPEKHL